MRNKILLWVLSAENPDFDSGNPGGRKQLGFFLRAAAFRLGILGLYLRLNKELERGPFSIVVF